MKKYVFIVPYIGKFPDWFQLWLNSCGRNELVDWLIFTDDHTPYHYPSNVIVHYRTFDELRQLFQSKFDFKIALNKPYKFCDFKPAYGEIFSKYLVDYSFWGYCDIDLIWGDLAKWINNENVFSYDRISHWGHCTLLKNKPHINSLYKLNIPGVQYFKTVFASEKHYAFDEESGFNVLSRAVGLKEYIIPFFDIKPSLHSYKFVPTFVAEAFFSQVQKDRVIRVSRDGVYLYAIGNEGELIKKEFAYVHLQKRKMKIKINVSSDEYIIIPNRFLPDRKLTPSEISAIMPSDTVAFLKRQILLWKSRLNVIKMNIKQKMIRW